MGINQKAIELRQEELEAFLIAVKELHASVVSSRFVFDLDMQETDGQLQSAIGTVMVGYFEKMKYPTLVEQAAALTVFIAKDHAFSDGNKRTAQQIPSTMFSRWLKGFDDIKCSDNEMYDEIQGIAKGEVSQVEFATWLKQKIVFK